MSERVRFNINMAALVAFFAQATAVVVFLTKLDAKASKCVDDIGAIRVMVEKMQEKVHEIEIRTTRLEEHNRISGDFWDHTKGANK